MSYGKGNKHGNKECYIEQIQNKKPQQHETKKKNWLYFWEKIIIIGKNSSKQVSLKYLPYNFNFTAFIMHSISPSY